jgi:ATP phosphoribosyltransferase regulatory subunit
MGRPEAERSFRFTENDGQLLALRPDVTSAIARAAATVLIQSQRPLRLCYATSVFRQHARSHVDWRREAKQIGCELIGCNSTAADMEILAIAVELLVRLGFDQQFVITLNDVGIFNGIVENLALDPSTRDEFRRLMDIRAIAELETFLKPYATASDCAAFAELIQLSGKSELFDRARLVITNACSRAALGRLENLWRVLEAVGMAGQFEIDLGNVSRLDYYTGLTFAIYVNGAGARIGGGGRYDNLIARFGAPEPAVGFVVELEALADLRAKVQDSQTEEENPRVSQSISNQNICQLFEGALARRAAGERVRLDTEGE